MYSWLNTKLTIHGCIPWQLVCPSSARGFSMTVLMKKLGLHLPFIAFQGESLIHMPCARLTVLPERSAHKFSSVFVTISYLISIKLTTNKNGDKINVRKRDLGTERYLKSTPAAQL